METSRGQMQGGISWIHPSTSHTLHPRQTRQSPHALSVARWITALRIVLCAQLLHQQRRHRLPHGARDIGRSGSSRSKHQLPARAVPMPPPSAFACHGTMENAPSQKPATSSTFVPRVEASTQHTTAPKLHLTQATTKSTPPTPGPDLCRH